MKEPTTDETGPVPAVVWLDDSMELWNGKAVLEHGARRLADSGISFEPAVFTRTDDAVEFIVNNPYSAALVPRFAP